VQRAIPPDEPKLGAYSRAAVSLHESDRITSRLLFQRPKFEPSALNPTGAHHCRFLVIGVIGVIASYRSKPNTQPQTDLRAIIVTASSASSASSSSSSSSLRHTDQTQPTPAKRLAHHHRHSVIRVITSHRSKPTHSHDATRTIKDRVWME